MKADYARSILSYDKESGIMYWKSRPEEHFKSKRGWAVWNARYSNCEVGNKSNNGYIHITVNYNRYLAHRVVWLIHHGEWPDGQIDHINGIRSDNRIENLRCVTNSNNAKNMGLKSTNSSGVCGVTWCKRTGKWQASITVNYKSIFLGRFSDLSDAKSAREVAEIKYNFHNNHGKKR